MVTIIQWQVDLIGVGVVKGVGAVGKVGNRLLWLLVAMVSGYYILLLVAKCLEAILGWYGLGINISRAMCN